MLEQKASLSQTDTRGALQPMGFTDILDRTFGLYGEHFRLFFGITVVYFVAGFCTELLSKFFFDTSNSSEVSQISTLLISCIISLVSLLVTGAILFASAETYSGHSLTASDAFERVFDRFFPYLVSSLLYFLAIVGLAVTVIGLPVSIYLIIRWCLYGLPVLLEGTGVGAGFKRSSQLVQGMWWRVLGISLGIFFLCLMLQGILKSVLGLGLTLFGITSERDFKDTILWLLIGSYPSEGAFVSYAIEVFVHLGVRMLILPILSIGSMLIYFDLRIRKEGFGIETMDSGDEGVS